MKKIWRAILILALIGVICALGFVAWNLYISYNSERAAQKAREEVAAEESQVSEPAEPESNVQETKEKVIAEDTEAKEGESTEVPDELFTDLENPIDFEKLNEINPELYAWIRIPDTNIDYPIAQSAEDDSFYLYHDMYKNESVAGWIYTEKCNSTDFSDPNTVIYGHNMRNTTMFQNLHLFENSDFFDKNEYIYIYMKDRVLVYRIFAAYSYDDRHIMHSFDFNDREVFARYLDDVLNVRSMYANVREGVSVTADDKIITLETCVGTGEIARYIVQGVLVQDSKVLSNSEGEF